MKTTVLVTVFMVLVFLLWWVYSSHNVPGFFLPNPEVTKTWIYR